MLARMSVPERVLSALRALPGVTEEVLWGNDLVYKVGGKMFAVFGLAPDPASDRPDVGGSFKVKGEDFDDLASRPGLRPAPYLARAKWVAFDGWRALPIVELEVRLRASYDLVRSKLSGRAQAALGGSVANESQTAKTAKRPGKRGTPPKPARPTKRPKPGAARERTATPRTAKKPATKAAPRARKNASRRSRGSARK